MGRSHATKESNFFPTAPIVYVGEYERRGPIQDDLQHLQRRPQGRRRGQRQARGAQRVLPASSKFLWSLSE